MSELLVSVIIPAWNREKYIGEAIQSVLAQKCESIEIIVVDDGSTDSTVELARAFGNPVRVVVTEHQGVGAARNRGLDEATGRLIAWLDSDDLWTEGSLPLRIGSLNENPAIDMVFGHLVEFHDPPRPGDSSLQPYPGWAAGTMLCDRGVFGKVGKFDSGLRLGEFISWCTRARELGLETLMLPQVVGKRRIHASNLVSEDRDNSGDYLSVVRAALARKRARRPDSE